MAVQGDCHGGLKNGENSHWSRKHIIQRGTRQSQSIFRPTNHKSAMTVNRITWQYSETLVYIRRTAQYYQLTTRVWEQRGCTQTLNELACICLEIHSYLLGHRWLQFFQHICNIKHRLDSMYSSQKIFNAKSFNPHKKANPSVKYGHLLP